MAKQYLFLLGFFLCLGSSVFATETERPNVVIIIVDDLGWGDLSCYGGPNIRTPCIDTLSQEGMRFTKFRANSSVCSPSRAALLSGMYPDRAGVPGVIRTHEPESCGFLLQQQSLITLPEALQKVGYQTAHIGKWHLGLESPNLPNERGFDFFHGFLGDMMEDYWNHLRHGINYMRRNGEAIDVAGTHATDLFTDWACEYLEDRAMKQDKPFFLYLSYNAPHDPVQPPPNVLERIKKREPDVSENRARLIALIEHLDEGVGKVLTTLEKTGLDKNTLVIFLSDNGGPLNTEAYNGPHRDGKGSMYEGGLAISCLARWNGKIKAGSVSEVEGVQLDIYPTVLELAGVDLSTARGTIFPQRLDGFSLLGILTGKETKLSERPLYFVRREASGYFGMKTNEAYIDGGWKILQNTPFSDREVYDLNSDPLETKEMSKESPPKFRELEAKLRRQIQEGGRVPWMPPAKD
jgi:arylsulfatase A-like enzyme